jgi:hypothetical protein
LIGQRPQWFACPFGGSGAAKEDALIMRDAMNQVGIVASVSTEKQFVNFGSDPLALPRFDAIDLPPKRAIAA